MDINKQYVGLTQKIGNRDYPEDKKREWSFEGNLGHKTKEEQEGIKNNFLKVLYNHETRGKKIEIFKVFPKGGALGTIDGKKVFIGHNRNIKLEGKEGTK